METGKGEALESQPVDIVSWLAESWSIYKKGWFSLAVTTVICGVVLLLAQAIPYGGNLLFMGPLTAGFFLVIGDIVTGVKQRPARVFQGFTFFVPAFLSYLLITVFTTIGFFLLVIPGLIVGGWYLLTYIFIIDRGLNFWDAMEASRNIAFKDIVGMTIFYLVLAGINAMGLLSFFAGILVSLPFIDVSALGEVMEAGREIASGGGADLGKTLLPIAQAVLLGILFMVTALLFTVPFTNIAVFVAYEKLAGFTSLNTPTSGAVTIPASDKEASSDSSPKKGRED